MDLFEGGSGEPDSSAMPPSEVSVERLDLTFRDVLFERPLRLSSGPVDGYTLVLADASVVDRVGQRSAGLGAGVLSIPWAWPTSDLSVQKRDAVLRATARLAANWLPDVGRGDPLWIYDRMVEALPTITSQAAALEGVGASVPALAGTLAIAALDSAIHDAWARAAGESAYRLYVVEGVRGGPRSDRTRFRARLPVQHVVGLTDPLTSTPGEREQSLEATVREQGVRHVKVKIGARDVDADADRIAGVAAIVGGIAPGPWSMSLDPNEGFEDLTGLARLFDRLHARHPAVSDRVAYIEQPIPRGRPLGKDDVREAGLSVPVIIDEGLAGASDLASLADSGWNGLAVKAARGQSLAVRSHAWAIATGAYVTIQDLTAVDIALEHSARLASAFAYSHPAFEYNSRQYAPRANDALARRRPSLVQVHDGSISISTSPKPGIY
jgi:L-alanine-DL-glutamate epimerase-like enolase superfamily enzyme